jgi:hypothetical protein
MINGDRLALYLGIPVCVVVFMLLAGCGEPASCWNDIKGRFTSCQDMRKDETDRQLDKREQRLGQADCKSGAGCCRPRVQDGDPKIECNDDDWRKP